MKLSRPTRGPDILVSRIDTVRRGCASRDGQVTLRGIPIRGGTTKIRSWRSVRGNIVREIRGGELATIQVVRSRRCGRYEHPAQNRDCGQRQRCAWRTLPTSLHCRPFSAPVSLQTNNWPVMLLTLDSVV